MDITIKLAIWSMIGLWSFILTQNHIDGWEYVRSQPKPWNLFFSSMLMGPITTLTCFYTIFMYHKTKGGKK